MRRILSLLLALFPVRAACQPLFPCAERLQSPYGVCTHITRPGWDYEIRDRELQLLAETGIRWVRSDLDFHRFFTSPTATDPAVFSRVLDSTEGHGEHLLGILTWQGSYPWDDARYGWRVAELARTFDRRITHWEVLNEVNLFRGVDSLCPRYVSTLRLAYETLKRVNPSNVVLSSGFGELPEPFISDFSSLGGWRYCDVFNFHSYFTPEGLIPCFERLHGYMQRDGWKRPVWVTECGMHTARDRTSSADFFTSLLPAALARLGIRERKVCVGVLRNPATGYSALYDDEASLLLAPYCRRVRYIDFAALETLDVRRTPVLVATRDEYFPRRCQPALVDYVRRGGTIVLAGGMPFYYDANTPEGTYFDRRERGTRDYAALHMAAANRWSSPELQERLPEVPTHWGATGLVASDYAWQFGEQSPARYLDDSALHPGDSLLPLVTAGSENFRLPVAGIYRLNSDLHGNIIFQTRMYAMPIPDREAEQARRVGRLFLISLAYGVERVFWYNLRSREKDPYYSEDCFGLIHSDFSEKPSMQAYRTLVRLCPEGSSRPTLDRRDDLFHAEWQRSDGRRVHALWSSVGKRQVRVRMGDGACLWDHLGNPLRRRGGRLMVGCGITYVEGELSLP